MNDGMTSHGRMHPDGPMQPAEGDTFRRLATFDLTDYASSAGFRLDPWQEQMLQRVESLPIGNLQISGRFSQTPWAHWRILGRTHPRVRRMHAAYGRRHGRGRW